jgi:cell division septum initiation protein DivIVA
MFGLKNLKDQVKNLFADNVDNKKRISQLEKQVLELQQEVNILGAATNGLIQQFIQFSKEQREMTAMMMKEMLRQAEEDGKKKFSNRSS